MYLAPLESIELYHQVPSILLCLLLLVQGFGFLVVGLGIAAKDVRSITCICLGLVLLVETAFVFRIELPTAWKILFGAGIILTLVGPAAIAALRNTAAHLGL